MRADQVIFCWLMQNTPSLPPFSDPLVVALSYTLPVSKRRDPSSQSLTWIRSWLGLCWMWYLYAWSCFQPTMKRFPFYEKCFFYMITCTVRVLPQHFTFPRNWFITCDGLRIIRTPAEVWHPALWSGAYPLHGPGWLHTAIVRTWEEVKTACIL